MIVFTSAKSTLTRPGHVDDLGDAGHGVVQHVVGALERVLERRVLVHHFEQLFVQHDDQRVDLGDQVVDALVGDPHLAAAFVVERLGDDADGQDAEFLGDLGHDRRGAGAGALAHAGGDEHHVGALQRGTDVATRRLRRCAAGLGVGARRPDPASPSWIVLVASERQRLAVGIDGDELHPLDTAVDHVVDRVAAAAADPTTLMTAPSKSESSILKDIFNEPPG